MTNNQKSNNKKTHNDNLAAEQASYQSGNIFMLVVGVKIIITVIPVPRSLSCVCWAGGCGLLSLVSCTELHRLCTALSHHTTPLCPGESVWAAGGSGGQSLSLSVPESPPLINPNHTPLLMQTRAYRSSPLSCSLCPCPLSCTLFQLATTNTFDCQDDNLAAFWFLFLLTPMCFFNLLH